MQGALMQDSGLRDLLSALNHLPNVALGFGPGAKVHTVFSSESGEYPVSIFIKLFIKRFFLNISAGAQSFFHSYLCVTTCCDHMLQTEQYKEFRGSSKHQGLE